MARPNKEGIDYFSFDTDFFENKKVRKIMRACGPGSATILICLLCNIYRDKGYYILWDEDLPFDIADKIGASEGAVSEVITKALQVGFLHKDQFEKHKILTSEEIQNRYRSATTKRQDVVLIDRFIVSSADNPVNDTGNRDDGCDNEQSKVKESKVKETIGTGADAPDPKKLELEKKQKEFYQSLVPYVTEFGKKMIRAFFDYWSEPNKSGTKIRWELERTWDLKKRLDRWRNNDDKFSKNSKEEPPPPKNSGPKNFEQQVDYLFGRWSEGQLDERLITIDLYFKMETRSFIAVGKYREFEGHQEEQMKQAVIDYFMKRAKSTVRA